MMSSLCSLALQCGVLGTAVLGTLAQGSPIRVAMLNRPDASHAGVVTESVLPQELPGVATDWITIVGPARFTEPASSDHETVWLFIGGKGELRTKGERFAIEGETIARAPRGWSSNLEVRAGDVLLALRVHKDMSDADKADAERYPQYNTAAYVRKFSDCPPYTEAIKSPNTVSRTLLPENYGPRMAIGTVEAKGPDQVRRHKHPMLEQYFVGLDGNDATVSADDERVALPAYSLLHIPLGSMHGAQVAAGHRLYYVWIDFFLTKEGQEWLKMHRPIEEKLP